MNSCARLTRHLLVRKGLASPMAHVACKFCDPARGRTESQQALSCELIRLLGYCECGSQKMHSTFTACGPWFRTFETVSR